MTNFPGKNDAVYKLLLDMTSDAIVLSDGRGVISFCSQKAAALLGFDSGTLPCGCSLLYRVAPEKRSDFEDRLQRVMSPDGQTETFKLAMTKTDGSNILAEVTLSAIRDRAPDGSEACALWLRDISSRVKEEEDKKAMEQQLRAVYKMEALGQLARGIAHDLNNGLGAISGYIDLIKRLAGNGDARLLNYADKIASATERSAEIINKLLTFARKNRLQIISFDMNELISDIVKLLQSSFEKNIGITMELNAGDAVMIGDPGQIQNSIVNLAINARDAMSRGGALSFKTDNILFDENTKPCRRYTMTPGYYLTVSVTDSGNGMDKQTMDHLFEPFFTTKEPGKGTGLGLASVYGSVKSHNGYIDVESAPNSGSTFTIFFPVNQAPSAEPETTFLSPPKRIIIVIDDERALLEMLIELLSWLGYSTAAFENAKNAIDYYAEHHAEVELAIIDWKMPGGINGVECFRALRKINPRAKAILATGYCIDDERQGILREGISGILPKPFVSASLSKAIAAALA